MNKRWRRDALSLTKHVVSSASWVIFIPQSSTWMPRITSELRIAHERVSTASMNRYGDSRQPCLTPLFGANQRDICLIIKKGCSNFAVEYINIWPEILAKIQGLWAFIKKIPSQWVESYFKVNCKKNSGNFTQFGIHKNVFDNTNIISYEPVFDVSRLVFVYGDG